MLGAVSSVVAGQVLLGLIKQYALPMLADFGVQDAVSAIESHLVGKAFDSVIRKITDKALETQLRNVTLDTVRDWNKAHPSNKKENSGSLDNVFKDMLESINYSEHFSTLEEEFIDCFNRKLSLPSYQKAREYVQFQLQIISAKNSVSAAEHAESADTKLDEVQKTLKEIRNNRDTVGKKNDHDLTSTAPWKPTTKFIGRETEIGKVTEMLFESGAVAVTGMGGLGKTELARKVYDELKKDYD